MATNQIERKKQAAAESLMAWRAALKDGDTEKAEKAEASFREAHESHRAIEADERQDGEMREFENEYLEPATRAAYKARKENGEQNSVETQHECVRAYLSFGTHDRQSAIDALAQSGMQPDIAKTGVERARAAHSRAFVAYCTGIDGHGKGAGERAAADVLEAFNVGPAEMHTLLVGEGDRGGFLVPTERMTEVLADMPGARVMRTLARVVRVASGQSVIWPSVQSATTEPSIRTSKLDVDQWTSEGRDHTVSTSDAIFGEEEIRIHEWGDKAVVASRRLLSSTSQAETIILQELLNQFTADEDKKYIVGTGASEPKGCLADSNVATVISGHATLLRFAGVAVETGFMHFLFSLDAQYASRATLLLRRLTLKDIMLMENPTTNEYVWNPTATPDRIMGYPFAQSDFVAAVGAGANVALLGDFGYGYVIAESDQFRVLRLDQWKPPKIGFLPIASVGGKIVRPRAFVRHQVSAT